MDTVCLQGQMDKPVRVQEKKCGRPSISATEHMDFHYVRRVALIFLYSKNKRRHCEARGCVLVHQINQIQT